jgi:hypothetical protein
MVARYGGRERWAQEMGVTCVQPRLRAPAWDEDRIRRELRVFLTGRDTWPTAEAFRLAGRAPLWGAIMRAGGSDRWAFEFGLRRQNRRAGSRRTWTEARIENELRRFLAGSDRWPKASVFAASGKASLFTAAYRYGGIDYWAARLGLPRPPPRRRPAIHWTEDRIRAELKQFCADRRTWPRQADFAAAQRLTLYWAASRAGGMRRWEADLGFITAHPQRSAA